MLPSRPPGFRSFAAPGLHGRPRADPAPAASSPPPAAGPPPSVGPGPHRHGTRALPAPGPGPCSSPVPGRCEGGPWRGPLTPARCGPHPALPGIGPWRGSRDADWVRFPRMRARGTTCPRDFGRGGGALRLLQDAISSEGQQHKKPHQYLPGGLKEHPSNLLQMPFSRNL